MVPPRLPKSECSDYSLLQLPIIHRPVQQTSAPVAKYPPKQTNSEKNLGARPESQQKHRQSREAKGNDFLAPGLPDRCTVEIREVCTRCDNAVLRRTVVPLQHLTYCQTASTYLAMQWTVGGMQRKSGEEWRTGTVLQQACLLPSTKTARSHVSPSPAKKVSHAAKCAKSAISVGWH